MTIREVLREVLREVPPPPVNKLWFINPGLTLLHCTSLQSDGALGWALDFIPAFVAVRSRPWLFGCIVPSDLP